MIRTAQRRLWAAALFALKTAGASAGTVVLDHSFGHTTALSGPTFTVPQSAGLTRGGNLFQSLKTLRLNAGETLTFTGDASIGNVLTRITGGSAASINGTLRCAIPRATFYLISPGGVVFGPAATLQISGSLVVTTAQQITLADGHVFAATKRSDATLSTASPASFGFLTARPAAVTLNGSALKVAGRQSITVGSGALTLAHGATLRAPGGEVSVLSVASSATSSIVAQGGSAAAANVAHGAVNLSANSSFNTSGIGGGRIVVRAGDLSLDHSGLEADTHGSADGKGIDLSLTGDLVNLGGYVFSRTFSSGACGPISVRARDLTASQPTAEFTSGFATGPRRAATGAAGSLSIKAHDVTFGPGMKLDTSSFGPGGGGDLNVVADTIRISGDDSPLGLETGFVARAHAGGAAGNVRIHAHNITLRTNAQISSSTNAGGAGGSVSVTADRIVINRGGSKSGTGIFADASAGSTANGGSAAVRANSIDLLNGGSIDSDTFGPGAAGDVSVTARRLQIAGLDSTHVTGISSDSLKGGGAAGAVTVSAKIVRIGDGGTIASRTFTSNNAGDIRVAAKQFVIDSRGTSRLLTGIDTETETDSTGAGGSIFLTADSVSIVAGGLIDSETHGSGVAGRVQVVAHDVKLDGRGSDYGTVISSNTYSSGNAGTVRVHATNLNIRNAAGISSDAYGTGDGGAVSVTAAHLRMNGTDSSNNVSFITTDSDNDNSGAAGDLSVHASTVDLSDQGLIESSASGRGAAGSVTLRTRLLNMASGAELDSDTSGSGAGGKVVVDAERMRVVGDAAGDFTGISTDTDEGSTGVAGTVRIHSRLLEVLDGGQISSSSYSSANAGNIEVEADQVVVQGRSADLPTAIRSDTFIGSSGNAGKIVVRAGQLRIAAQGLITTASSGTGRGGDVDVHANDITLDGVNPAAKTITGLLASTGQDKSGPAGRISVAASGQLRLLNDAYISTNSINSGGGDIAIQAGSIALRDGLIGTNAAKAGGDISIAVDKHLALYALGRIRANSGGAARGDNGGNITIGRTGLAFLQGVTSNAISANANQGNGGNINIAPGLFLRSPGTPIDAINASSVGGIAGTITVQQPNLDLTGQLVPLVTALDSKNITLAPTCSMQVGVGQSSFTLEGGNGLPADPAEPNR